MSRSDKRHDGDYVIVKDDPFSPEPPRLIRRDAGRFIKDFVDMGGFAQEDRDLARAFIDGEEVPAELWAKTAPTGCTEIVISAPAGEGDKILRTVLTLAVVAASFYIGGWAAAQLGLEAGTAAYSATAAVVGAVVSTLGTLAINAILPPPRLSGNYAAEPEPVYFINGARNQLTLNQPLQTVLGEHRFVPRYAARPYPEIRGDESYYYVIFDLGPIGVEMSDVRVGETPIGEIDGAVAQWRLTPDDPVPSMASRQVISEPVGATLGEGDWETRRTASDTIDCDLILFFPQGLGRVNNKGKPRSHSVSVQVRYRKVINPGPGETLGPWLFASAPIAGGVPFRGFSGSFDGLAPGSSAGNFTYSGAKPGQPFYRNLGFSFPSEGTWEVSVQRVGADEEVLDRIYDDIRFETILSKRDGSPILRDDVAWGVIRFKGTEETSGVIDTVNMVLRRLVPVFPDAVLDQADLSDVTEADLAAPAVSSNPWEIILWMARNGFEGRRAWQDNEIHWPDLARAARDARDRGKRFDHVVQRDVDLADLIDLAAFAGEGRCFRYNGRLCAEIDRPQLAPTHFFREGTARNIRMSVAWPQEVHGFRVTFNDAQDGWREREVIIYVNGHTKATATRIEPFSIAGKTDWTDLHECLQQQYRNSKSQTVTARLEVPIESVDNSLRKMSWVSVATRVLAQTRDTGVIRTVAGTASVTGVTLDQPIEQGPYAGPLALRWVRRDDAGGLTFSEAVILLNTPQTETVSETVTFDTAVTGDARPQAGDEYIIGPSSVEIFEGLLDKAEQAGRDWLRLSLKSYAPARFNDTGFSVPDHVPVYDLPFDPVPPTPVLVFTRADERQIVVGFTLADGFSARIDHFKAWRAEAAAEDDPNPTALGAFRKLPDLPATARQLIDDSLTAGDRVVYRLQAISDTGRAGALLQTGIITASVDIGQPQNVVITPATEQGDGGSEKPIFRLTFAPDPRDSLADMVAGLRKVARDSEGARLAEGSQPAFAQAAFLDPATGRGEIRGLTADTLYDVELYYRGRRKEVGAAVRILNVRSTDRDVATTARGAEGLLALDLDAKAQAIADVQVDVIAAQQAASDAQGLAQEGVDKGNQALADAAAAAGAAAQNATDISAAQSDIEEAQQGIEDLASTYGDTASASESAAEAAASAAEAATSEDNAAASASTASGHAIAASGHADNAEASETAAGQSASAASASATQAATQADNAEGFAQSASTSADSAAAFSDDAGDSAAAASQSASTANTAASNAEASEIAAAESETNADGSATAAAASASQSVTASTAAQKAAIDSGQRTLSNPEYFTDIVAGNGPFTDIDEASSWNAGPGYVTTGDYDAFLGKRFRDLEPDRVYEQVIDIDHPANADAPYSLIYFFDATGARSNGGSGLSYVRGRKTSGFYETGRRLERFRFTTGSDFSADVRAFNLAQGWASAYDDFKDLTGVSALRVRASAWVNYGHQGGDGDARVYGLWIEDVTETVRAEMEAGEAADSASASAQSASSASASEDAAGQSANAAQLAATDAETARSNAETFAGQASSSASAADGSASDAEAARVDSVAAQAAAEIARDNAEDEADAASQSASAAAGSASTATAAASQAGTFASAAEDSATEAATEAGNASTSASQASSSATQAGDEADAAASSATAAAGSATQAATHAGDAEDSADAAEGFASSASTSASQASTSASDADGSASSAALSATAAANSRSGAEAAEEVIAASLRYGPTDEEFNNPFDYWSTAYVQSNPPEDFVLSQSVGANHQAVSTSEGAAFQVDGYWYAAPSWAFDAPRGDGRTIELTMRVRCTQDATNGYDNSIRLGAVVLSSGWIYETTGLTTVKDNLTEADGWQTYRVSFGATGTIILPGTGSRFRPMVLMGGAASSLQSNAQNQIVFQRTRDITAQVNAELAADEASSSASAAANSASTANTAASDASSAASAAESSELAASASAAASAGSATDAENEADAAAGSASAAQNSATAANTAKNQAEAFADDAQSYASASETHSLAAEASASDASDEADAAAGAASAASTSASAANTAKDQAEAFADDAQSFASASESSSLVASSSASAAEDSASDAAGSAGAASLSATDAIDAVDLIRVALAYGPTDEEFNNPLDYWGTSYTQQNPPEDFVTYGSPSSDYTPISVPSGSALQVTGYGYGVAKWAYDAPRDGRTLEISVDVECVQDTTNANVNAVRLGFAVYDGDDWSYDTLHYPIVEPLLTEADGRQTYKLRVGAGGTALAGTGSKIRPFWLVGGANSGAQSNAVTNVYACRVRDVTALVAAEDEAAAAAGSATAAETSATASNTAKDQAESFADDAQGYASAASGHALAAQASAVDASDDADAAANSALASASSATTAEGFATDAESYASAADTSRIAAETAEGFASASAGAAATSAENADTSASTAESWATLSARVAQSGAGIVTNPKFADWPVGQAQPTGYGGFGVGSIIREVSDGYYPGIPTARFVNTGTDEVGVTARSYYSYYGQYGFADAEIPTHWVVSATVKKNTGDWAGSGIYINMRTGTDRATQSGGTSFSSALRLDFESALPDVNDKWFNYNTVVEVPGGGPGGGADGWIAYLFGNWGSFSDSGASGKDIEFAYFDVRPATHEEIEAGKVETIEADVSTNAGAIATVEGGAAWHKTEVSASGSDPAIVSLRAGKNGSVVGFAAKIIRLINNVGGTTIEVMRAVGGYVFFSNPISIDRGGKRLTLGSNADFVLWCGPDTIDPPNQTLANSDFTFGVNGLRKGTDEILSAGSVNQPLRISLDSGSLSASRVNAGSLSVSPAFVGSGGTGPYTFSHTPLQSPFPQSGPDVSYDDLIGSGISISANSASNNVLSRWTVLVTMTDSNGDSVSKPFSGTFTWGAPA